MSARAPAPGMPTAGPPRRVTAAVAAAAGLPLLSISASSVALPSIAGSLSASFDELQWVVAVYAVGLAGLQLVAGPLADRVGRRRATCAGLVVFALGAALASAAPTAGVLIAGRAVQGVGGAFVLVGALGLVAVTFAAGDRLRVLALRSAIIATAFAVGPLAGGLLTDAFGWRTVFAFDVVLAAPLLALLATDRRPEAAVTRSAPLDVPGLLALGVLLVAIVYVAIRGNAAGWLAAGQLGVVAVAVAAAAVVVARQRADGRLIPAELLRDRRLARSVSTLLVLYATVFGGLVFVTLHLRGVVGLSPTQTGLLLVSFAAASLVAVLLVTRDALRAHADTLVPVAVLLSAAGLAWIAMGAADRSAAALVPGLILVGLASGVINPLLTAGQIAAFAPRDGGVAAGLNGTSRQFGTALGVALLGALVQQRVAAQLAGVDGLGAEAARRVAAGDLAGGLAGATASVRADVVPAYQDGLVQGLQLAAGVGAAGLVALAVVLISGVRQAALRSQG